MNNGVKLRVDSRQRKAHLRFGQIAVSDLPAESNFGFDLFGVVEPESAVSCTAFSVTKVRASQTKKQYDINDLWKRVPSNQFGAAPEDTIGAAMKGGLKDVNDNDRDFGIKGYYAGHTGNLKDAFDNTMSAMFLGKSSSFNNTYWFAEWSNTVIFGRMPIGKTAISSHSYEIVDWKVINGETVFLIDSHQGQKRYMPRETYNAAVAMLGCSNLIPCDQKVLESVKRGKLQWLSDQLKNLLIIATQLQISIANFLKNRNPNPPIPVQSVDDSYNQAKEAVKQSMIQKWAGLVAHFEGANPALNNPGNFKYSSLMASFGATQGPKGSDGGYFAKFATLEKGMSALCDFLTLACKNELIPYHNARTIKQFTLVFTNHPKPQFDYSDNLIKQLGVTPNTDISTFLT